MAAGNSSVQVKVTKFGDRKFLMMYYDDPLTGRRISRSTKETTRKAAERVAAKWEAELQEGRYKPKSNVTWEEFKDEFLNEHLQGAPATTFRAYATAFHAVERHLKINKLAELDQHRLAALAARWRDKDGLSAATVGTYLGHLRSALRWAYKKGMLHAAPIIEMPRGASGKAKGRPITLEEFERMLSKVEAALATPRMIHNTKVEPKLKGEDAARHAEQLARQARDDAPAWTRLLWGLWLSGLRLNEALELTWDDDAKPRVDLSGKYPMLYIPADQQKGTRDTVTAIVPDFYELLAQTPPDERTGLVFPVKAKGKRLHPTTVSRVISTIGELAGVVVNKAAGKFASAHDLRRSFGTRWSAKPGMTTASLMELMRHRNINTTMKYYVGQNAEAMAASLWQVKPAASAGEAVETPRK
jgi:integrase